MSAGPLRVGFDVTNTVKRNPGGIAVYVRGLLQALPAAAPEIEAALFIRDGRWFKRRLVAGLLPAAARHWLPGGWGPGLRRVDAFHSLGVRLPRRCRARRSFTLHDLRGLDAAEYTDPHWTRVRSARIRETVARAARILFHTEHARARFFHHFPAFPAGGTAVAHPGIDHAHFQPRPAAQQEDARRRLGLAGPFLLQVGQPVPHKNPEGSVRALAASRAAAGMQLAFAGGASDGDRRRVQELADALGVGARLRWLGRVAQQDLPALYCAAELLLMPSHYEGFGFPVLEAMACGAAGVAGAGTSLEEVAGEAWPAVDPRDPEQLAACLDRILEDPAALAAAREQSRRRAAGFTWESCARRTADFLIASG